jgi:ADP-ribose pyrophosphatase YjhB (NUDIX family)
MQERFNPYAAALALLIKNDSILLLRRADTNWANGLYTLPSGHIDEGESAIDACIREAKEEVGIVIDRNSISLAHVLHRRNKENSKVFVDFILLCTSWDGEPINNEPHKCDDVRWFKLDSLPDNMIPFVRVAIENYQRGVYFSAPGWNE